MDSENYNHSWEVQKLRIYEREDHGLIEICFKFVEILEGMICKWFDINIPSNRSLEDGS